MFACHSLVSVHTHIVTMAPSVDVHAVKSKNLVLQRKCEQSKENEMHPDPSNKQGSKQTMTREGQGGIYVQT